jgi:peroxiredoxin/ribosomal protein S18 acetylase RimI-like enzyme
LFRPHDREPENLARRAEVMNSPSTTPDPTHHASPNDPTALPPALPAPIDDGAAAHLRGRRLPDLALRSTAESDGPSPADLSLGDPDAIGRRAVLFFYPRTGVPGQPPSLGFSGETWDSIPGARGCTPQSCGFRDLHASFDRLGVRVWGVSTNTTHHQREFKYRMHVPYELLSDSRLELTRAMSLPTFEFPVESGGPTTLLHRMAWYVEHDAAGVMRIRHVWYPVFPPDRNAAELLSWLTARREIEIVPVAAEHAAFVRSELVKHWNRTRIRSRDKPFDADRLPGFVATRRGVPDGLVTIAFPEHGSDRDSCEVITLSAGSDGAGIGSMLMDAAEDAARVRGLRRLYLTTTNDNWRAQRFYQRRAMRIIAVHPGMIDRYRREYDPKIPVVGASGVPIRDEFELAIDLPD